MRRIILIVALFFIIILGCLWASALYEYAPVIKLPDEDPVIKIADSVVLHYYLNLDGVNCIESSVGAEHFSDSIVFTDLDISVNSVENPSQTVTLTHVLTYKDSVDWVYPNDYRVRADKFKNLSNHYKTQSIKRQYNGFTFSFATDNVENSKSYVYKIEGTAIYNGQIIHFSKTLTAHINMEFIKIQFMT